MENLLKLLKQYWRRTFNDETLLRIYYEEKTDCFCWMYQPRPGMKLEQGQMLETPVVFSKSFGFIKWLVDNDKIDKKKIDTRLVRHVESHYDEDWYWVENSYEDYSDTDTLLMLLSISNSPIEDLLLYLK